MKLTEEECLNAFNELEYYLCELEEIKTGVSVYCIFDENLDVFNQLIKEYFELLTRYEKLDEYTNKQDVYIEELEMKEENDVVFLCDRKQCVNCSSECKHTTHIEHAMNFEKQGKIWFEKEPKNAILRESIHYAHFSKYQGTEKKRNALKIKALKRF